MRALCLLLLLLAGCSSSASSSNPDATTNPPDGAVGLTCGTTISAYCNANGCDQTLTAAKQDKSLCPASLNACGDFDVITKGGLDTATIYFYQAGQLVAIDNVLLPGHHACAAGPGTFAEPSCGNNSQTLPACGP
jgi:hypothetical protein